MNEGKYKSLLAAADFFSDVARKGLTMEGRLHADTLIASVSRMAGSLMYQSFGFDKDIPPGTIVLSPQADIHGSKLMNIMLETLRRLGHQIEESNLNSDFLSSKSPKLSFKESTDRLSMFFFKYCEVTHMALQDAAFAAAMAAGALIHDCREVLAIENGGAIAVYGFIEGTKTAPYSISSSDDVVQTEAQIKRKPWYKVW